MMWWNNGGWDAGEWLAMGLMMLIFWGAVIALGVELMRSTKPTPTTAERTTATDGAKRQLTERFDHGEIDETQPTRSRALLGTSPAQETRR